MRRSTPAHNTNAPEAESAGRDVHDHAMLDKIQRRTFEYFLNELNHTNGLSADKPDPTGRRASPRPLALTCYPIGVEQRFWTRAEAVEMTLTTLRFFHDAPQGSEPDATGYKGFFYHFLDMEPGRRAWKCDLSTVDSALLLAGALVATAYFDRDDHAKQEVRTLADALYRRADWRWAMNGGATVTHGWTPEAGFVPYRWQGTMTPPILPTKRASVGGSHHGITD